MGVATGCGFKEIYRFPHTTYPYSSCICTFLQQHPYFFFHFVNIYSFRVNSCNQYHMVGVAQIHVELQNVSIMLPSLLNIQSHYPIIVGLCLLLVYTTLSETHIVQRPNSVHGEG